MSDKGYNVIARVAGGILLLIAALLLLIQVPAVQSRLGRIVADRLENALDGKVSWSDIRIMAPNAVLIKDLLILDSNPYTEDEFDKGYPPTDTLGYLKTVAATFSLKGLLKGEGFHVRRAYVADGAFNLVIFQDGSRITNNINSIFRIPEKPAVRPEPGPDIFDIRRVKAKNVRYTMRNFTDNPFVYKGTGINWMDMDILVHEARGHGLKFTGGRMHGICDHISATEKCGFRLKDVSGSFAVGQGKTEVKDLVLVDNWSDLKLDEYTMHYDTPSSFAHYLDSVKMGAKRIRGTLDMRTINVYSGGALEGNELALDIKDGQASGYVSDFYVNKLRFTEKGSGVSGGISGRCTGLPDINAMLLDADVHDLTFRTDQLGSVIGNFAKGSDIDLSAYAPGQTLTLNGNVRGPMNGITFTGGVGTSSAGSFTTVATVRNILDKGRAVEIDADVTTRNLDVGKLAGGVPVGPVSLSTKASAVLSGGMPSIDLKDLDISDISALGHEFKGMKASGAFTKDGINSVITSTDPAADFNIRLDGTGMPKDGNADYKLSGTVSSVLLSAFGIDTKGMADSLSAKLSGTLRNTAADALEGNLEIYDVKVGGINGTASLENVMASLETRGSHADLQLSSEVLDARYSGSSDIQKAISDIQKVTTRRELPSIYKTPDKSPDFDGSDAYEMALVFHNPYTVLQFIAPKLYVSDSTRVNLNVDEEGNLVGRAVAPRLAYNGTYIKDAQIGFDNYDGLNATVTGSEIKAGAVMMKEPALTAFAEDDLFSVQLHYDNVAEVGSGEIYVNGLLERDAKNELVLTANPLDSYINVENQTWEFGESEIVVKGKDIDINRFLVSCGEQRLFVDGGISSSKKDTLDVYMDDFNLAIVDEFLENKLGVKGFLTGEAHVISPTGADMGMMLKFDAEQVAMGGTPLGNFNIAGRWDNDDNKIRAFVSNDLGERIPLTASLAYGVKDKNVSADLKLDGFSTAAVKPVVNSIMSDIGGTLSGHVTLGGNMDKPVISSEGCRIDSVFFRLIPTGVTYFLNGDFAVDGKGVHFEEVDVRDRESGRGTLNGSLTWNNLKDFGLDAGIRFYRLLAIDSEAGHNLPFYGKLKASGSATVKGPFQALQIDANARTADIGEVHARLNSSLIGSTSDLLTFLEAQKTLDHYEQLMKEAEKKEAGKSKGDLSLKARATLSPEVTGFAEFNTGGASMASVYGSGTVDLELRPSKGIFTLNGDYGINGGNIHLDAVNLLDKEFTVKDGSSVSFGGNILDTGLDVTAVHTVKTSLSNLLSDSTVVGTRRPVDCELRISDKLRNPSVSFAINVPDLDPTTKSMVEGALNTQDKIQKQFVSLLLFGTFLPSEVSGIVNSTSSLLSNMGEIFAGQVNSILQKLDIPLDLGFGYQNDGGTDIFDVAVSTQLFNNRVIVNGSFGNRQYKSTGSTDMVGDVDVDIKLDREGTFRVNLFSHSADDYTNYLDYSQRSGAGISYQKEFSTFGELIRSIFRKQQPRPAEQPRRTGPGKTENVEVSGTTGGEGRRERAREGRRRGTGQFGRQREMKEIRIEE